MSTVEDFLKDNISRFGYASKRDMIERLYLQSLVDSYGRIAHMVSTENEIRDRFVNDLHSTPSQLKTWLDWKVLYLDWENWKFTPSMALVRADISFKITGCEFIIECKRLSSPDKAYFNEGLLRFVTHHYAKGDDYAGMIAFVINDRGGHILSSLKLKASTFHSALTSFSSGTFAGHSKSFQSSHLRTDGTIVDVYHLLFEFNSMIGTAVASVDVM